MTLWRSNSDFSKSLSSFRNQVIFQESHSFSEKSDEESEDEETESIRESIESETEMTDVVFNKYNLPEGIVHTPGCRFFVASTLLTEDIDMIIENTDDNDLVNTGEAILAKAVES